MEHSKPIKPPPEYGLLSGAARKRFWKLVSKDNPMAPKQAAYVASRGKLLDKVGSFKHNAARQGVPYGQSGGYHNYRQSNFLNQGNRAPKPKKPKVTKTEPEHHPKSSKAQSQDKYKAEDVFSQVEIHNTQQMAEDQVKMLHEALLLEIAKCEAGTGPRVSGFVFKEGWVLVTCHDYESQKWIINAVQDLKPWPEAELSTILKNKRMTVLTFFPNTEVDSIENGLKYLKIQNKGLNTEEWTVLGEKEFEGGKVVTLSIDKFSFEAVRANKFKAILGFKNIYLKVIINPLSREVSDKANDSILPESEVKENSELTPKLEETQTDTSELNEPVKDEAMEVNDSIKDDVVQEPTESAVQEDEDL